MECKHCTSLITHFFFLAAFYSASLKANARTKCCSDTSKVMEFSEQKAFYTPNGMQRSLVNFQPLGPLSRAKGVRAAGCFMEPGAVGWQTRASGFGWESHSGTHGSCAGDVCGKSRLGCGSKPARRARRLKLHWNLTRITFQLVSKMCLCGNYPHISHVFRNCWSELKNCINPGEPVLHLWFKNNLLNRFFLWCFGSNLAPVLLLNRPSSQIKFIYQQQPPLPLRHNFFLCQWLLVQMSSTGYCPQWSWVALQPIKANERWGSRDEGMWLLRRASSVLRSLSGDTNNVTNKQICTLGDAAAVVGGWNTSPCPESHV